MTRIGLALAVGCVAVVSGQARLELDARMKMRMELKGVPVPPREQVLRRERIAMKGQLLRLDAGEHFLIQDAAKGTVILANGADKSYVRTTPEKFVEVVANYAKTLRWAGPSQKVEVLAAPAAPPFQWKGQETEASSCRFRITIQSPLLKEPMVVDSTVHIYSVPLTGEAAKALAASESFRMSKGAGAPPDLNGAMGISVDAAKALESCAPKGRMAVRSVSLTEMNMTAPVEMRMEAEVVFDVGLLPAAELGPELFTVPEGWTEAPAESLEERVMQYLQPPPAAAPSLG
jgi:hypothetical protein